MESNCAVWGLESHQTVAIISHQRCRWLSALANRPDTNNCPPPSAASLGPMRRQKWLMEEKLVCVIMETLLPRAAERRRPNLANMRVGVQPRCGIYWTFPLIINTSVLQSPLWEITLQVQSFLSMLCESGGRARTSRSAHCTLIQTAYAIYSQTDQTSAQHINRTMISPGTSLCWTG